jgi:LmbE family N-acetylglucosaminyl deacetylase
VSAFADRVDMNTSELGSVLSIWAHPDDETYLAGGVMAAAGDRGERVVCVSMTAGERGTSDPVSWPPDRLGQVRRWEAAAAMAVLGVAEHRFVGLPDGGLDGHDEAGSALVGALLDELAPDTILTLGPDGTTFHPDHIAVCRWVTGAWQQRGSRERLLYATRTVDHVARFASRYEDWGVYMNDQRPMGVPAADLDLDVRLGGAELDRKLTALAAMATQTRELMEAVGHELYAQLVAEESFIDARKVVRPLAAASASAR